MLRSIPGIGEISSRILSNELVDIERFNNERQLFSYLGLTPSENSSGGRIRKGNMTRQGNVYVRAVLIECAWSAIRKDKELKKYYMSLSARRGAKKAIVAVARKLSGRVRFVLKNKQEYEFKELST